MRIRTQLVLLVVAALLPIAVFAVVMTLQFWDLQRDAYEERLLERVRALRLALDIELGATVNSLQSISRSQWLETPPSDAMMNNLERLVNSQPS